MANGKGNSGGGNSQPSPEALSRSRKIPGTRRYLSPTGQIVTEYSVRKARRTITADIKAEINRESRVRGRAGMARRAEILKKAHFRTQFDLRKAADTSRSENTLSTSTDNTEYLDLMEELGNYRRIFRATSIADTRARNRLTDPTGPIANVLVKLGLRRPEDNFPVGMSPTHTPDGATSYSESVVAPYLRGKIG